jgi:hypothetical protein
MAYLKHCVSGLDDNAFLCPNTIEVHRPEDTDTLSDIPYMTAIFWNWVTSFGNSVNHP